MADVVKQPENSKTIGRPFPPGVSGNPNGRPKKGTAITDVMRAMMDEKPEIKKALSTKLFELALGGDIAAIREIFDRLEGKPHQSVDTDITTGGHTFVNITKYGQGDHLPNPIPLQSDGSQSTSVESPTGPEEISGVELAPEGQEDNTGDKPTDKVG